MVMALIWMVLASLGGSALASPHRVARGETLWTLAQRYYQSPFQWPVIAQANQGIKNPHWIYPGQVIEIPSQAPAPAAEPVVAVSPALAPVAEDIDLGPEQDLGPREELPAPPEPKPKPRRASQPMPAAVESRDGLSSDMPPFVTGYYPSWPVIRVSTSWREDGRITANEMSGAIARTGEEVSAELLEPRAIAEGEKFTAYRRVSRLEDEDGSKGQPLQAVARLESLSARAGAKQRMRVIKAADTLETGDLIKKD